MSERQRQVLSILLIYIAVLGSAASVLLFYRFQVPDSAVAIASAAFAPVIADTPADVPETAYGPARSLPDDWRRWSPAGVDGWYRAVVTVDGTPAGLWAVVLPTVRQNAELYLNGQALGNGGRFDDPVARNPRRPLIFNVPGGLLRAGLNEVHVRLKSAPDQIGYLDKIYFGPDRDLRPAWQRHYDVRVALAQIITSILLLISLVIGILAIVRRSEREYLYFSLGTLIWGIHSFSYFVVSVPFTDRFWDWLTFATTGLFAVVGGITYVHRYLKLAFPFIERRLFLAVGAMSLAMAFLSDSQFYLFAYFVWHPLALSLASYGLARMLLSAWTRKSLELHVVAASGLIIVAFGAHDLLLMVGLLDWRGGYLLNYAMLLALGLFCAVLLHRFVRTSNELEKLNTDLEKRMAEARRELEASYGRFRELENRRVVGEERDRIMRDMHDGMGGQLITTLAMIDEGKADLPEVAWSLRSALQDLRLMIDSLDVAGEDITTMLGMFRTRIEPALDASRIELKWQVEPIGDLPDFTSAKSLQVLRILQEAVTNVMKHSGANEIVLAARDRAVGGGQRHVTIELTDNGNGAGQANGNGSGRGIANMHSRATSIGAQFKIDVTDNGTRVTLTLAR